MADQPSLVPAATQEWADNDTPVFAVGIKSGISEASLIAITGLTDNSRVIQVDDFDQLAGITTQLLKEVCITIGGDFIGQFFFIFSLVFSSFCQTS